MYGKACAKIILFGEHSVVYGRPGIAVPIKSIITKIDLDPPFLCKEDPIGGSALYRDDKIILSDEPGFGFKNIKG